MHTKNIFLKFSLLYSNTIFSLLYSNTICFFYLFLRDLAVCMKTKYFFYFFNVLTKTRYFNTGFISLQYKNTNRYWSKCNKKFCGKSYFFKKNFFDEFNFFGLGPARPMWRGWTQQAWPSSCMSEFVSRVHEQCEGN
jgi:hypothetical protein